MITFKFCMKTQNCFLITILLIALCFNLNIISITLKTTSHMRKCTLVNTVEKDSQSNTSSRSNTSTNSNTSSGSNTSTGNNSSTRSNTNSVSNTSSRSNTGSNTSTTNTKNCSDPIFVEEKFVEKLVEKLQNLKSDSEKIIHIQKFLNESEQKPLSPISSFLLFSKLNLSTKLEYVIQILKNYIYISTNDLEKIVKTQKNVILKLINQNLQKN